MVSPLSIIHLRPIASDRAEIVRLLGVRGGQGGIIAITEDTSPTAVFSIPTGWELTTVTFSHDDGTTTFGPYAVVGGEANITDTLPMSETFEVIGTPAQDPDTNPHPVFGSFTTLPLQAELLGALTEAGDIVDTTDDDRPTLVMAVPAEFQLPTVTITPDGGGTTYGPYPVVKAASYYIAEVTDSLPSGTYTVVGTPAIGNAGQPEPVVGSVTVELVPVIPSWLWEDEQPVLWEDSQPMALEGAE